MLFQETRIRSDLIMMGSAVPKQDETMDQISVTGHTCPIPGQ